MISFVLKNTFDDLFFRRDSLENFSRDSLKRGIIGSEQVPDYGGNSESGESQGTSSASKRARLVSETDEANPYEDMD